MFDEAKSKHRRLSSGTGSPAKKTSRNLQTGHHESLLSSRPPVHRVILPKVEKLRAEQFPEITQGGQIFAFQIARAEKYLHQQLKFDKNYKPTDENYKPTDQRKQNNPEQGWTPKSTRHTHQTQQSYQSQIAKNQSWLF